ncbi:hypothetical protein ACHAXS_014277 [Conticribra weissflogii]
MLQKPGEARQKATAPRNRRRVVEEDLEDVIRRLQRLPPNKSCADCSSKLTQCVNLTHGTFVCMACSGVHRGFNHKIKGIGHSSFTPDEVARLRHPDAGNEAVNAKYLANYDPRRERLKPPHDNNDLQLLRAWIQRKYIDKSWLDESKVESTESRKPAAPPKAAASPSRPASSKSQSSKRSSVPKVGSATSPPDDLFGFDSFPPASAPASGTSWDAFGGSTSNQTATQSNPQPATFQADFGGMNNVPAVAPSPPPAPAFQANFGNFSQPTMVTLPPAGPMTITHQDAQQQQPFQANFGQTQMGSQTQPQQRSFQASFDEAPMNHNPQQQNQQPFQAKLNINSMQPQNVGSAATLENNSMSRGLSSQQQNIAQSGFANFGSVQQQQGLVPQKQQQQQQNQMQPQQSTFADFGSMQAGRGANIQEQQNNAQSGYGDFGPVQQQQGQVPQQPQNQMQHRQSGFADFGSMQVGRGTNIQEQQNNAQSGYGNVVSVKQQQGQVPQQQQQQQQQLQNQMQPQQSGFADFGSIQAGRGTSIQEQQNNAQSGYGNFGPVQQQQGQVPQQPQNQMQPQQSGFADFGSLQTGQGMGTQNTPVQDVAALGREDGLNFSIQQQQQQPEQQKNQTGFSNSGSVQQQKGLENSVLMDQQQSFGSNSDNGSLKSSTKPNETSESSGTDTSPGTSMDVKAGQGNSANEQQCKASVNPKAFRSSEEKKAAFDAFDGLSLEPSTRFTVSSATSVANSAASTTKTATPAKFAEGQRVIYTNQDGSCPVEVLKVHHDDELHPFYTISFNGREKQTEESRLSALGEHHQVISIGNLATSVHSAPTHREDSPPIKLQQTITMLQGLNDQQLSQVQQFIATLSVGYAHGMQAMGMTQQGVVNTTIGTENEMVQNQSMGMNNHQHAQMNNMLMRGNAVQNGFHPQMLQNQYGSVNPQSMDMGVGINKGNGMGSASMDSSIHSGTMGGTPSLGTPMGSAAPAAPAPVAPPPALPPVEKEGNPFDMY